jgi:acyl-coenzyme A thioesterase PaaI-like protein
MSPNLVPDGFSRMPVHGAFAENNGPFYLKPAASGDVVYGFLTGEDHDNPNEVTHGGMLFSFADQISGHAVVATTKRYCTTVSSNVDFLGAAKAGDWIEGETEIIAVTGTMAFVRALILCGDQRLLNVNSIFRLFGEITKR